MYARGFFYAEARFLTHKIDEKQHQLLANLNRYYHRYKQRFPATGEFSRGFFFLGCGYLYGIIVPIHPGYRFLENQSTG